jgi:hypothetical protein
MREQLLKRCVNLTLKQMQELMALTCRDLSGDDERRKMLADVMKKIIDLFDESDMTIIESIIVMECITMRGVRTIDTALGDLKSRHAGQVAN